LRLATDIADFGMPRHAESASTAPIRRSARSQAVTCYRILACVRLRYVANSSMSAREVYLCPAGERLTYHYTITRAARRFPERFERSPRRLNDWQAGRPLRGSEALELFRKDTLRGLRLAPRAP
jgi:hypothetical protein